MSNPYAPPAAPAASQGASAPPQAPGIRRLAFAGSFLIIIVIAMIFNVVTDSRLGGIAGGLFFLFLVSQRLANIGRHPMWCLLLLILTFRR